MDNEQKLLDQLPWAIASEDDTDEEIVAPRRLRRAEAILNSRTKRITVVVEQSVDSFNFCAVLRTCEALGVQNVFVVKSPVPLKHTSLSKKVHKGAAAWLTIKWFNNVQDCLGVLKQDGYTTWATSLGKNAYNLDDKELSSQPFPKKLAIVMGRELDGVSPEFIAAADKEVFIPMFGFTESYNLSVATGLVLQRLLLMCPEARGDLSEDDKSEIRAKWYGALAKTDAAKEEYAKFLELGGVEPLDSTRPAAEFRLPRIRKALRKRLTKLPGNRPINMKPTDSGAPTTDDDTHDSGK